MPACGQERQATGKGNGYLGGQARVQSGPPSRRPAMYTTTTGQVPASALPPTVLLLAGRGSHPYPKPFLVRLEQHQFKPQSGDGERGALGESVQSHNLESFLSLPLPLPHRFFFFGVGCSCVPCLACPASLCHAMPVGVRDESFRRHRRCATRLWPIRRKHRYRDRWPSRHC